MDDATWKLIQNCSRVSATPSTAMRLAHLITGDKYSYKKMEHIFEQVRGVVCGEDIIHPEKTTASNFLEVLDAMPNHTYLALISFVSRRQGCSARNHPRKRRRVLNILLY
jgi:hypothetical protein